MFRPDPSDLSDLQHLMLLLWGLLDQLDPSDQQRLSQRQLVLSDPSDRLNPLIQLTL